MKEERKLLGERKYKAGYVIRHELINGKPYGCEDFEMKSAYTPDGLYLGDSKMAYRLCNTRGIKPELNLEDHKTCSIGFCEREQKWYGWSHRAIYGFGIGDVVKEGDCAASSGLVDEWIRDHPEDDLSMPIGFVAKTLGDAKRIAVAFADSVS